VLLLLLLLLCDGGYIIHRRECRQLSDFDYVVVNKEGQLEECVDKLCAIIDAERLRTHSNSATAAPQQYAGSLPAA
jgi:hypothetical protein